MLLVTTSATQGEAERIAAALVKERLAACVQLTPVESWYRWQGKVERSSEVRLETKTTRARAPAAQARIVALHAYEVPEVVVVPIEGGSVAYLEWVRGMVS